MDGKNKNKKKKGEKLKRKSEILSIICVIIFASRKKNKKKTLPCFLVFTRWIIPTHVIAKGCYAIIHIVLHSSGGNFGEIQIISLLINNCASKLFIWTSLYIT